MRNLVTSGLFATGAAAAAIALSASAASASTWTVTNGGDLTAVAGTTTLTVHHGTNDVMLTCSSSEGTATVPNTTTSDGIPIGQITSLGFESCTFAGFLSVTVATNPPWDIDANLENNRVVIGEIPTGISLDINGAGYSARVSGPNDNADGRVQFKYDGHTDQFEVLGSGNLTIHNVNGCGDLIANDDTAGFVATYDVTPGVQITENA